METPLVTTASKWITTQPRYPGDLFHNFDLYYPKPDYTDDYWKAQHINAETMASFESRSKWAYINQAMFYASASSGRAAYDMARRYPEKILIGSRKFTTPDDEQFMTIQCLKSALDSNALMGPFVLAQNYRDNMIAAGIAAQNLTDPRTGERNVYIVGPPHREAFIRSLKQYPTLLRGAGYEDATFEIHFWGPFCTFDVTHGIYSGDHAWSRNAAMEKASALATQYGVPLISMYRSGRGCAVVDIYNQSISPLDQAWEDARHIVDVVGQTVRFNGSDYFFRTEAAVMLLLTRFLYDDYVRNGTGDLVPSLMDPAVKAHYASPGEIEKMDILKRHMLPYMANFCNWPTLHRALNNDPALKAYWEENVIPHYGQMDNKAETEAKILSYLPRGGCADQDLMKKVSELRDPRSKSVFMSSSNENAQFAKPPMSQGLHEEAFSSEYDPLIFNDRNFARLNATSNPNQDPSPTHYSFEQSAAIMVLAGFRNKGLVPFDAPRTLLFLDGASQGEMPKKFREDKGVSHPSEMGAIFDVLSRGGENFAESVGEENAANLKDLTRRMMFHPSFELWRKKHGVGNIIPVSDFSAAFAQFEGRREATNTEVHEAIDARGSMKITSATSEATVRRYIAVEAQGIVIPSGDIDERSYRYITDGVLATIGKTPRPNSGGKYQFEFFLKSSGDDQIKKLDLADLIILVGLQVKSDLEKKTPAKLKDRYVSMARLLNIYEYLIDPAQRNQVYKRDSLSGADSQKSIIDWKQVDPDFSEFITYTPTFDISIFDKDEEYQKFSNNTLDLQTYLFDPVQKSKLVQMIWAWMVAAPIKVREIGKDMPTRGNLLARAIKDFDDRDLIDLPSEYRDAKKWWEGMNARQRKEFFEQGTIHLQGPAVDVR